MTWLKHLLFGQADIRGVAFPLGSYEQHGLGHPATCKSFAERGVAESWIRTAVFDWTTGQPLIDWYVFRWAWH